MRVFTPKVSIFLLVSAALCLPALCLPAISRAFQHPQVCRDQPLLKNQPPRRVVVTGYNDDAMEPFISRDGRYFLFNNRNDPSVNTDIYYAEKIDDYTWRCCGKVKGISTPALEGCPTMDRAGRLFFVSTRSYPQTLCTIYSGQFQDGAVTDVQVVESISRKEPGIVNFDVDVSPDGTLLAFVDSRFLPGVGPRESSLVLAGLKGTKYTRLPDSSRLLSQVNAGGLVYAPTLSADKKTLYFTQYDSRSRFQAPQIYRATRPALGAPFSCPVHLAGLGTFVEGTALSPDERLLYFHRKDGNSFHLYAVTLR